MKCFVFTNAANGTFAATVARLLEISEAGLRPGLYSNGCWTPVEKINFAPNEAFAKVGPGGAEIYRIDPVEFQAVLEMLEQPLENKVGFFSHLQAVAALRMSECEDWVLDGRITNMEDGKNSPFYKREVEFCLNRHGKL